MLMLNMSILAVQKLEATVSHMPDSDVRNVWREQLSEIQIELKRTTELMMSSASKSRQQEEAGVFLLLPAFNYRQIYVLMSAMYTATANLAFLQGLLVCKARDCQYEADTQLRVVSRLNRSSAC